MLGKKRDESRPVRHKIFIMKDDKSETYGTPLTFPTRGLFVREVQNALEEGKAIFAKHPQDFSFFEIGEYDPMLGNVELYETKNCLGLAQDFKSSLGNN